MQSKYFVKLVTLVETFTAILHFATPGNIIANIHLVQLLIAGFIHIYSVRHCQVHTHAHMRKFTLTNFDILCADLLTCCNYANSKCHGVCSNVSLIGYYADYIILY